MQLKKKERLYVSDLLEDPAITFPSYYTLSKTTANNDSLQHTLRAIHSYDFKDFVIPQKHMDIFQSLECGTFVIYKQKYAVGFFGGKLMYLESNGWKSFNLTKDVFDLEAWLV